MSTGLFFVRRERMRTTTADLLVASNDGVELPGHLDSVAAVRLERLEAGVAGRGLHLAPTVGAAAELLELCAHLGRGHAGLLEVACDLRVLEKGEQQLVDGQVGVAALLLRGLRAADGISDASSWFQSPLTKDSSGKRGSDAALSENLAFPCADSLPWIDARHRNLCREQAIPAHDKTKVHDVSHISTRRKIGPQQTAVEAHGKTRHMVKYGKSARQNRTHGKLLLWSHLHGPSDGAA
jgi:hypothetical protein